MSTKLKICTTRDTSKYRYRGKVYNTPIYLNLGIITKDHFESDFAVRHYPQYIYIKCRHTLHAFWRAITFREPHIKILITGFNDKGYRHG